MRAWAELGSTVFSPPPSGVARIRPEWLCFAGKVSLSVERRGFARLCCRRRSVLGGSARCRRLSRAEGSGGGRQQRSSLCHNWFSRSEERRTDRPDARGLPTVVTFNPLCAERPPRDRERRRAALVLHTWDWLAGLRRPGRPTPDAEREPRVAMPRSAQRSAPGVLPRRLGTKTSFPVLKTHRNPQTSL